MNRIIAQAVIIFFIMAQFLCTGTGAALAEEKANPTENIVMTKVADIIKNLSGSIGATGGEPYRIVVMPFESSGEESGKMQLGKAVSEIMVVLLSKDGKFSVIERDKLSKVMEELKLGMSGLIDSTSASQVGKVLGAQGIMTGTVSDAGMFINVSARIVDVETAQVKAASFAEIEKNSVISVAKNYIIIPTKNSFTAAAMAIVPGLGQFYTGNKAKGKFFAVTEFAALTVFITARLIGDADYAEYERIGLDTKNTDPAYLDTMNSYFASADSYYNVSNISLVVFGALWGYSIFDAIISVDKYNEKVRPEVKMSLNGHGADMRLGVAYRF